MTSLFCSRKCCTLTVMASCLIGSISFLSAEEEAVDKSEKNDDLPLEDKNPEDPTKIVTRLGAGYNGDLTISGSFGLDKVRMISGFVNSDASEWRLGGSWLFEKGIVNFNFKKTQYDGGGESVSYNIGSYIPLKVFGFEPCGWQIFPSFGFNYTDGEIVAWSDPLVSENPLLIPIDSKGFYAGVFTIKPINDEWTMMLGAGGSYGNDDTTNVYGSAGVSYRITKRQSFNLFYSVSESSSFGGNDTLSINYRFEFN